MEGHAVANLHAAEALQERGELVHPVVEILVRALLRLLVLRLGHPYERRLVGAGLQVAVDAVDARVQPTADEPLPERRVAGVQGRLPLGIPGEQVGVLLEAVGKLLLAESLEDGGVVRVCLLDELWGRLVVLLLTPVNGDL